MSKINVNKFLSLFSISFLTLTLISCHIENSIMPINTQASSTKPPGIASAQTFAVPTSTQQRVVNPVKDQCAKKVPVEQIYSKVNGNLLLYQQDPYSLFLADLTTNDQKQIDFEKGLSSYNILVSPNLKSFAMAISTVQPPWQTKKLQIVDSAGVIQKEIAWKGNWGKLATWLDNNQIIIVPKADLELSTYNPKTVILLDINTGHEKSITVDYPDVNQTEYVNWNLINYIYSPDFTRVLYPTSKVDPGYINYVALWDMENKKVLATIPVELSETSTPQWSQDGSQVLISGLKSDPGVKSSDWRGQELFSIDAGGVITQLTHFTDYYSGTITIDDYVWSPDGEHVAFWMQTEQMATPLLFTLNTATGKVINNCIAALPAHAAFRPIWSPDGDYLLIVRQDTIDSSPQIMLMNNSENTVVETSESVTPIGWLTPP